MEDIAIEDFKRRAKEEGFTALEKEIVLRGLCSGCGTCSAVCPKDAIEYSPDGYPSLKEDGECTSCGLCSIHCPRSFMNAEEIEASLFKGEKDELGYHIQRLSARASDPEIRGVVQDGGVVSAILKYAFEKGMIDGAVLCKGDERFVGSPYLAKSWGEALPTAKSKYNLSPNLVALRWAREEKLERVALVGLPCHISAFRKLEFSGPKNLSRRVVFTVGIFCSENFCEKMLTEFLPKRGVDPEKITKLNIKGAFRVEVGEEIVEIPLAEMKSVVNQGCLACRDFTAEFSDISVGAVGSPDGWCTVITRTTKGDGLLGSMIKEGVLETGKLTKPKTLRKMSLAKRKKGNERLLKIMRREAALPLRSAKLPSELKIGDNKENTKEKKRK